MRIQIIINIIEKVPEILSKLFLQHSIAVFNIHVVFIENSRDVCNNNYFSCVLYTV